MFSALIKTNAANNKGSAQLFTKNENNCNICLCGEEIKSIYIENPMFGKNKDILSKSELIAGIEFIPGLNASILNSSECIEKIYNIMCDSNNKDKIGLMSILRIKYLCAERHKDRSTEILYIGSPQTGR